MKHTPRLPRRCAVLRTFLLIGVHSWLFTAFAFGEATPPAFEHRTVSNSVGHAKVADVDGDGRNDIVLHRHRDDFHIKPAQHPPALSYLRWPEFGETVIFRGPIAGERFAVVDMNGDGFIDIVSAQLLDPAAHTDKGKMAVYWFENPGRSAATSVGEPWKAHLIGEHPGQQVKDVAVGDVDSDGQLDVVVRAYRSTSLFFRRGAEWALKEVPHQIREGLALADLDGDRDLDVVLNGFWLETPADPLRGEYVRHDIDAKWFNQKTGGMDNGAYVAIGDINRDGLPDIVISHPETVGYPVSWYSVERREHVKAGPWKEHVIAPVFDWCESLEVADIDRDGDLDVFAAKFQRHSPPGHRLHNVPPFPVSVFYNEKGDGSSWRRQDLGMDGVYAGVVGDVGSDGDLDIVGCQSYWRGPFHLWENKSRDVVPAGVRGDNSR